MVYVGIYALIYLHTILGEGIVSRDGLPRGVYDVVVQWISAEKKSSTRSRSRSPIQLQN